MQAGLSDSPSAKGLLPGMQQSPTDGILHAGCLHGLDPPFVNVKIHSHTHLLQTSAFTCIDSPPMIYAIFSLYRLFAWTHSDNQPLQKDPHPAAFSNLGH